MTIDPTTLKLKDAQDLLSVHLAEGGKDAVPIEQARAYFKGDHWEDGKGWIGPRPPQDDENYTSILEQIEAAFVSKNVVAEIVRRHRDGVIGHEPIWSLTVRRPLAEGKSPTKKEQDLIDEAEALLTSWWDARKPHKILKRMVAKLLWARRGSLRLFVPTGKRKKQEGQGGKVEAIVPKGSPDEVIQRIYLVDPEPEQAGVLVDTDTMEEVGVWSWKDSKGKAKVELSYTDEAGQTVVRVLSEDGSEESEALALGGRLTIFEVERDPVVTKQVIQNQRLVNQAMTMLPRNVNLGGFLERVIFNAQMPGYEVDDADAPNGKRFVPLPYKLGAGTTNVLKGIEIKDEDGTKRIASPSIQYKDPVPVTTFKDTKQIGYENILEETDQIHVLVAGDATASGESRKQARAGFESSLLDTKPEVDGAVRWLLETVLALAAAFSGQPGRYASLRAVAQCRIDAGPRTADEDRQVGESYDRGLLSRATAMSRIGVEDVDAESAAIDAEREAAISAGQAKAAAAADAEDHPDESTDQPAADPNEADPQANAA